MGNKTVKTTVDLPDPLFRKAKAAAAEEGKTLKDFFTEAVIDRLQRNKDPKKAPRPWEAAFGGLTHLHRENKRVDRIIEKEFETIDEEEWR